MAALDVKMVLSLVDKASGPAKGIMSRLFGRGNNATGGQIAGVGAAATAANGAMVMLNRTIATFAAGAGAYVGFRSMIGGAVAFEAAFADVQKKVNASPAQFAALEQSIKQIARETPLAAVEIANLVAQAGQFGIATEDLTRFATLGARAAVAFDMGATEASESLSQMKNALKLNLDQLSEYADAINMVADSMGSSEQQLIDFVLRTGPAAMAAGLDPKDLLAFGGAMTEVGISSQRAGTGVNGMLAKMTALTSRKGAVKVLDSFAGKGYSASLQKKFFERPREALVDLLTLTKEMSRPDRAKVFIDLFGLETQDEALALAGQVDVINQKLRELGNTASYIGSVDKTFDLFSATTEAQWKQFKQNIELSAAAIGSKMLPAINSSLTYLNRFFATADERVDVFDRLKLAANGFFHGLGLDADVADKAMKGVYDTITGIRDLIFGVEGDGASGDRFGEIFESWRRYGEDLRNSPIITLVDSLKNANFAELGGSLIAASLGLGALSIAARIALAPVKLLLGAIRGIVGAAYTLSGLRLAKSVIDMIGGAGKPAGTPKAGNLGLLGLLGRLSPWAAMLSLSGSTAGNTYTAKDADGRAADRARTRAAAAAWNERHQTHQQEREWTPPGPLQQKYWWDAPRGPGGIHGAMDGGGASSVSITGPVATVPTGVQEVHVTNPAPAPIVNITVNATTNASPAQIGAEVGAAARQALSDMEGLGVP